METETVDNDMAAHIEGSRTDTDSVDRDTETNFNIYLITHNVEEPIKDDKEEEEADAWEEKKPKTNKVEKITWDWELCNSSKPIWTICRVLQVNHQGQERPNDKVSLYC